MRYLHTMIRVLDLDAALDFFVNKFGLVETRRIDNEPGRFTLVFLAAPEDVASASEKAAPVVELTHNWDETEPYPGGRNFGHLAYEVDDIYGLCEKLQTSGVIINRPPRDGRMAFIRTPDGISIELLQKGGARPPQEPWASAANIGSW
jgi:lactoylglutathione lyase